MTAEPRNLLGFLVSILNFVENLALMNKIDYNFNPDLRKWAAFVCATNQQTGDACKICLRSDAKKKRDSGILDPEENLSNSLKWVTFKVISCINYKRCT